jgi:hypothetical protein
MTRARVRFRFGVRVKCSVRLVVWVVRIKYKGRLSDWVRVGLG